MAGEQQLDLEALPWPGCTDGSCVFGHPGGMHTNGGCKCVPLLSELKRWTPDERIALRDRITALAEARTTLLAEVRRLREAGERVKKAGRGLAVSDFLRHHQDCPAPVECICGLWELRAAVEAL